MQREYNFSRFLKIELQIVIQHFYVISYILHNKGIRRSAEILYIFINLVLIKVFLYQLIVKYIKHNFNTFIISFK
jgi:hypothetical protein